MVKFHRRCGGKLDVEVTCPSAYMSQRRRSRAGKIMAMRKTTPYVSSDRQEVTYPHAGLILPTEALFKNKGHQLLLNVTAVAIITIGFLGAFFPTKKARLKAIISFSSPTSSDAGSWMAQTEVARHIL